MLEIELELDFSIFYKNQYNIVDWDFNPPPAFIRLGEILHEISIT